MLSGANGMIRMGLFSFASGACICEQRKNKTGGIWVQALQMTREFTRCVSMLLLDKK